MSKHVRPEAVHQRLEQLAKPLTQRLLASRKREATRIALRSIWLPCLLVPMARFGLGSAGIEAPLWVFIVAVFAIPLILFVMRRLALPSKRATEREALCMLDDRLGLADRLNAAAEFSLLDVRTAFMDAAIQDAEARIDEVAREEVPLDTVPLEVPARAPFVLAAAIALLLVPLWRPERALDVRIEMQPDTAVEDETQDRAEKERPENEDPVSAREPERKTARPSGQDEEGDMNEGVESEDDEESPRRSSSSAGRSSQTKSSGGRSRSTGQASLQSQPSKAGEQAKSKTPKKPKKEGPEKDEKPREKQEQEESGATAGRGSGKGSSKSPTTSPWSTKDQVATSEEPEADDDEEVEDDFDESKARGGVQPHLRSRKPPVNRDLQIGFGSGPPNPEANGRGGAGLPKKQRGVAQLVLGVHFPDHISGKPNPGMSKITQERIEPQQEHADELDAADRMPRSSPVGPVARPQLSPWMQSFVRTFLESNRIAREMENQSGSR